MIKAVGRNLILKPYAKEKAKKFVVIYPNEKQHTWEVVSVGETVTSVEVGDIVYVHEFSTSDLTSDGDEELKVVTIDQVYAKKLVK